MLTVKGTEIYHILENDGLGGIPIGTSCISINYACGVPIVGFLPPVSLLQESLVDYKIQHDQLNRERPTTLEGIEKIIQLVKESEKPIATIKNHFHIS